MRKYCPSALLLLLALAAPARGQITPIGPFSGTYHENTENIGQGGAGGHAQLDIFQGFGLIRNTFRFEDWYEPRFLEQVLKELELQNYWVPYAADGKPKAHS